MNRFHSESSNQNPVGAELFTDSTLYQELSDDQIATVSGGRLTLIKTPIRWSSPRCINGVTKIPNTPVGFSTFCTARRRR